MNVFRLNKEIAKEVVWNITVGIPIKIPTSYAILFSQRAKL